MQNLAGIREFVEVVNAGGFTKAAAKLHCSKAHVSKQVKELESQLGVLLLNRSTRNVGLTELGESFFKGCVQALSQLEQAAAATTAARDVPHGTLRMLIAALFGELTIAGIVADFASQYPQLELSVDFVSRSIDTISADHDVLITRGTLRDSALIARKLAESELGLFASPAYFKHRGLPKGIEDLARHNCLLDESECWWFDRGAKLVRVRLRARCKSNRGIMLLRGAMRGMGIAQLPVVPLRDLVRRGTLAQIPGRWARGTESWYVLYPRRTPQPATIRRFIEFVAERFARPEEFPHLAGQTTFDPRSQ